MDNTRKWLESVNKEEKEEKEKEMEKEKKKKKKKKKAEKSKKNKKTEVVRPKPGEDTVLLDQNQMKHASLPMGAVEIGTIAETESYDEEDDETNGDDENDSDMNMEEDELKLLYDVDSQSEGDTGGFIGPINLIDDPIPDVMIKVRE